MMDNPFDIWMCTYNSEKLLPITLKRINQVIPSSAINRKFIVDDFSSDNTKQIAKKLGWQVYENKKKGLAFARHYAFSLVETDYCACFEHDLFLSEKWFPRIPKRVINTDYDIAQGVRIRDAKGFRELDIYDNNHRNVTSEDNTFYAMNTANNRDILTGRAQGLYSLNLFVDKSVCSRHIRGNSQTCLRHGYYIYRRVNNEGVTPHVKCLIKAPLLGLKVAKETKGYSVIALYPLERLMILSGAIVSKANQR